MPAWMSIRLNNDAALSNIQSGLSVGRETLINGLMQSSW